MKRNSVSQCDKLHSKALQFVEILQSCLEYSNYSPDKLLNSAHVVTSSDENGPCFGPVSRLSLGLVCKDSGAHYRSALLIAMSSLALNRMITVSSSSLSPSPSPLSLEEVIDSLLQSQTAPSPLPSEGLLEKELQLVQAAGSFVMRAVDAMNLEDIWSMPPLLDGMKMQEVCILQPSDSIFQRCKVFSCIQIFKNIPPGVAFKLVSLLLYDIMLACEV